MNEYHKIPSIYKRDERGRFLTGQWSEPWMEYLCDLEWTFTEKVDGTNIRVMFNPQFNQLPRFGGRTDNAQILVKLLDALGLMFPGEKLAETFDGPACLYGEGYGADIQKGGGDYIDRQSFILFDVRVGNWWLKREDVEDVARKLNIGVVPIIYRGTLEDAAHLAFAGFPSEMARPPKGHDVPMAEGIVCRPAVDLFDRAGRRIIAKVKTRDMRRAK